MELKLTRQPLFINEPLIDQSAVSYTHLRAHET